ncbi:MAG: ABC-2 type transport system permease protein, partial [Myxococcota bacterium]
MSPRTLLVHTWAQTVLWIAIAITLNHTSAAWFGRVDLTSDQRFSLSAVARATVGDLDRPLIATVWFTEDLDPPYHNHRDALADKLAELQARSRGSLEVRWRDPTGDEAAIAEARAAGIQPITYTFKRWDRQEARQVWMGVSLVSGDRQEVADGLVSTARMEYDLVRAIRAVTTPPEDRPVVAWLLGDGEPDLSAYPATDPLGALREQLRKTYSLRTIAPGPEGIPEEVDALLVVGPQHAVPPQVQLHLDQFLVRGGGIAWFLSGHQPDFETGSVREVRHGLHPLLGHHGVQVGRDLLLDRDTNERMAVPVAFRGQRVVAQVNHPLALVTTAIDRTFAPVRDVRRVVAPFVGSVSPSDSLL